MNDNRINIFDNPQIAVSCFWKGRVALYAILKALDIQKDDEIILPAFTCVVVPSAIKYLCAKPVYVDIDPDTYNIDINKIEKKITRCTRVILAQNTFGLSSDLDPILRLAKKYNLNVIEDCAHGFGGTYKGRPNGTIADASFYSTQWNKPFSTGIGGIAVTKNETLAGKIIEIETQVISPSMQERISLRMQLFARDYFLRDRTYWILLGIYRFLSRHNIITGSSQGYELESPEMPPDFLKGFSGTQYNRMIKELNNIKESIARRKKIADRYKNILSSMYIGVPAEPGYAEHTFLKFPLLVENRDDFIRKAEKARIELGDWFISPLHPVTERLHLWDYTFGEYPIAEFVSKHIVNLPTHNKIDDKFILRVEKFLSQNRNNLIPYSETRNRG